MFGSGTVASTGRAPGGAASPRWRWCSSCRRSSSSRKTAPPGRRDSAFMDESMMLCVCLCVCLLSAVPAGSDTRTAFDTPAHKPTSAVSRAAMVLVSLATCSRLNASAAGAALASRRSPKKAKQTGRRERVDVSVPESPLQRLQGILDEGERLGSERSRKKLALRLGSSAGPEVPWVWAPQWVGQLEARQYRPPGLTAMFSLPPLKPQFFCGVDVDSGQRRAGPSQGRGRRAAASRWAGRDTCDGRPRGAVPSPHPAQAPRVQSLLAAGRAQAWAVGAVVSGLAPARPPAGSQDRSGGSPPPRWPCCAQPNREG